MFAQLYAAYARGIEVRDLAVILGEAALGEADKKFLEFANGFEERFITQDEYEDRSIEDTLNIGWDLMKVHQKTELKRVKEDHIKKYMKEEKKS